MDIIDKTENGSSMIYVLQAQLYINLNICGSLYKLIYPLLLLDYINNIKFGDSNNA